jgi:hypothetical protein
LIVILTNAGDYHHNMEVIVLWHWFIFYYLKLANVHNCSVTLIHLCAILCYY